MANDVRGFDPGTRAILEELHDLRLEMRADRQKSDDRFERMMREFREDSARREAATQKAFRQIHTVGLALVKTLNRHTKILDHNTRILERIDHKLSPRWNGRGSGRTQ